MGEITNAAGSSLPHRAHFHSWSAAMCLCWLSLSLWWGVEVIFQGRLRSDAGMENFVGA